MLFDLRKTGCLALVGLLFLATPLAQAQRRHAVPANADGSTAAGRPARLLPLFGGLSAEQATALVGAAQLRAIAASFASPAEASTFLSTKGLEYIAENQPDTAAYRLNLAWLLDPQNPAVYRGWGLLTSTQPTPDQSIALLVQGLALAPTDALLMSDLGSSYFIRYRQSHKKKDLTTGVFLLQRATTADPSNASNWQQLAQGYFEQGAYPQAWAAVHKGRALTMSSIDFGFVSELLAKQPDPEKVFK